MDIKKIISEEFKRVMENYPAGAQNDPSAPWNQEDPKYSGGEKADEIKFKVVWYKDNAGTTLFKDGKGNLYALASDFSDEAMKDYGSREMTDVGQDEDGFADYEYGELEIDEEAVENYVNANIDSIGVGKGLSDHEQGMLALVDDEVMEDVMGLANFYIKRGNEETGKELKQVLQGGINETVEESIATDQYTKKSGGYFDKMLIYLQRIEYATQSNPEFSPEKKAEVTAIIDSMRESIKKHIKLMMDASIPDNELAEISDKLVHTDRMMTPTGTLFFMSAMEESINRIKKLLHEPKKNN